MATILSLPSPLVPGVQAPSLRATLTSYLRKLFYHHHHHHSRSRWLRFQAMDADQNNNKNKSYFTEISIVTDIDEMSNSGNNEKNCSLPDHHYHNPTRTLMYHRHSSSSSSSLNRGGCHTHFSLLLLLLFSLLNTQIIHNNGVVRSEVDQSTQSKNNNNNNNQTSINLKEYNAMIRQQSLFCQDPPLVPHAQSNLHRNQKHYVFPVGMKATYQCEQGYRAVSGNSETRCIEHPNVRHILFPDHHHSVGELPLQKSNRAKNSKRLSDLDEEPELNASSGHRSVIFPTDFTINDKRKAGRKSDADDLYDYDGHPGTVKRTNPEWYPPVTLNCQKVHCDDPGQVEHATRQDPKPFELTFNKNIYYICDDGYEPVGIPFLICRADGTWNREPPKCVPKKCPKLPELANGYITYSDPELRINSRAEYHCNHGYRLNSASPFNIRLCTSDNKWSQLEPLPYSGAFNQTNVTDSAYQCLPVTCPAPVRAHNGVRIVDVYRKQRVNKTQYVMGDLIIYSCVSNRMKTTAKCRDDGEWSQPAPHCPWDELSRLKCTPISSFWHGEVKIIDNQARFSCKDGYELDGPDTLKCNSNGAWSGRLPRCVIPMTLPQVHSTTTADTNHTSEQAEKESLEIQEHSMSETLVILLVLISLVVMILICVGAVALYKWRQRQLNSKTWQRYFGHYYHRQSKTNIVASTTFGLHGGSGGSNSGSGVTALTATTVGPGTVSQRLLRNTNGGGRSHHIKSGYLQSSFSSADENASEIKSSYATGTISSERARTVSTYVDDTCPEDDEYDEYEDENVSIYKSTTLPMTASVAAAKQTYSVPLDVLTSDIIPPSNPTSNNNDAAKRSLSSNIAEHTYSNVPKYNTKPLSPITTTTTIGNAHGTVINGVPVTDL